RFVPEGAQRKVVDRAGVSPQDRGRGGFVPGARAFDQVPLLGGVEVRVHAPSLAAACPCGWVTFNARRGIGLTPPPRIPTPPRERYPLCAYILDVARRRLLRSGEIHA